MGTADTREIALYIAPIRIRYVHGGVDAAATEKSICGTTVAAAYKAAMGRSVYVRHAESCANIAYVRSGGNLPP